MSRPPNITRRKYTLNKFEVKPFSETMFDVYYSKQKIGWFSRKSDIITTSNSGKNQYIFLKDGHQVIGTISFEFNIETDKWKIGYIKLRIVPDRILSIRKVLFEKFIDDSTFPEMF